MRPEHCFYGDPFREFEEEEDLVQEFDGRRRNARRVAGHSMSLRPSALS
jgi:hypothetical protein